jgi:hypothetical protein
MQLGGPVGGRKDGVPFGAGQGATMRPLIIIAAMLPAFLAGAPEAGGDETEAKSTQAAAEPEEKREFEPPPGFRPRKRGELVVYCRREEPKGSRFPTEVCYDEQGIRNMLQSQREDQAKVDQIRRTRATGGCCG